MSRALGELELSILLAAVHLEGNAYGASILRTIEARTGREVKSGAVYTALDRMQSRGLVRSSVGEPTPERGGRRRRFYELSPKGLDAIQSSLRTIRSMTEGVEPKLAELKADGRA